MVWYGNNLLIGGYQAGFYFDPYYRDTPKFEAALAKVTPYLDARAVTHDFTAMFGCHPVITEAMGSGYLPAELGRSGGHLSLRTSNSAAT